MSNNGVRIHGSINLQGGDTEIRNLELEQVTVDPLNENLGTVWFNESLNRVSYNETTGDTPIVRRVAHDSDISNLSTQIATTATELTTALTTSSNAAILQATTAINEETVINNTENTLLFGQPVYMEIGGSVFPADATNIDRKTVVGLVCSDTIPANGGIGQIKLLGKLSGTSTQWSMVTNVVGGLLPDSRYFLDIYSGRITNVMPTGDGQYCCIIGYALSNTDFVIKIERPIAL